MEIHYKYIQASKCNCATMEPFPMAQAVMDLFAIICVRVYILLYVCAFIRVPARNLEIRNIFFYQQVSSIPNPEIRNTFFTSKFHLFLTHKKSVPRKRC